MKLEFDTLRCVKMLKDQDVNARDAEALASTLAAVDIRNLYDRDKVDIMKDDIITNTIAECRREFDKQMAVREKYLEAQIAADIAEARAGRRQVIGTIITVGLALAGYLSAVIHFSH